MKAPTAPPPSSTLASAYEALSQRMRRYQALLELSADWFWETDEQLRFVTFGVSSEWPASLPAMGMLLGRARWEVPGYSMPEGWDEHRSTMERHEAFRDVEVRHRQADGRESVLCVSGTPLFGADGRFEGYIGVGRDVTESHRAREALRESQRAMSALIANLPGMAYRCANRPDWPMTFASDGALALTGYAADNLLRGQPTYGELIHPEDRERVWEDVQSALAKRGQFQLTYRLETRGGERWMWERGSGVYAPDGTVLALEGFVTDITDSKLAQQEVASLNASLEQRVSERTAQLAAAHSELQGFAYAIAHDLRAPLTTIAGFSQLLERSLPPSAGADQVRWLQRMAAGVHQLGVLSDALLALASLSAATLQDEEVDLAELARAAFVRLHNADPAREAEIDVAQHLWTRGDPRLLAQVVAHLVDNAWKFSRRKPRTTIRVGSRMADGETVFFVADDGAGFDMAHAGRLFTSFQRLHTAAEFEGAGVGLALSHKIVTRHGGRMWVDALLGEGATFYFTLPQAPVR